jgi:CRP/FNR family transcriptional regulator, cyclic AMP receptor protein
LRNISLAWRPILYEICVPRAVGLRHWLGALSPTGNGFVRQQQCGLNASARDIIHTLYAVSRCMFKKFLGNREPSANPLPEASAADAVAELDASLLMEFLCAAECISPMSRQEAKIASSYMRARQYGDGDTILKEGDKSDTHYMLWILHGEAVVEALSTALNSPITVTVLGPGTTLGELSLMDGGVRSLTCTASGNTRCATLTKGMLQRMAIEHPDIATKLISIIFIGVSVRLRDLTEKLKRYVRLNQTMNEELRETMTMQVLR